MTEIYRAIAAIGDGINLPVSFICDTLGVSRSAFYAWRNHVLGIREREFAKLIPTVEAVFRLHRRRYGARRVAMALADQGISCGPKRVAKILKTQGIRAIQPKSFVPKTTQSRHGLGYSDNLLLEVMAPNELNKQWVGDITYLPLTSGGGCYLAGLMDLFSRNIVGWIVESSMTESLVLGALKLAIRDRQPKPGLIHHSDRGRQYAGSMYRSILIKAGIQQSMSRPENVYDNSFMESCWTSFKRELEMTEYESVRRARTTIGEYVRYYRFERKHSSLGYLTPNQFETRTMDQK